ncbi:MAG: hypothetical protein FWC89_05175 [Defluviitaleaceae bacterium]|nr:hypothetical protein [Defluviitaleaceae bacterium]
MICKNCGEVVSSTGRVCGACGTWNSSNQSSDTTSSAQQNTHIAQSTDFDAFSAKTDFFAEFKRLTKSVAFILGCLLITIGAAGSIFVDFTWLRIFDIALIAVQITALWILVVAAFSSTAYKKTLTALSMLKASVDVSQEHFNHQKLR